MCDFFYQTLYILSKSFCNFFFPLIFTFCENLVYEKTMWCKSSIHEVTHRPSSYSNIDHIFLQFPLQTRFNYSIYSLHRIDCTDTCSILMNRERTLKYNNNFETKLLLGILLFLFEWAIKCWNHSLPTYIL